MAKLGAEGGTMDVPRTVQEWVDDVRGVLQPARVHWCDGSEAEREALEREAVASGVLMPLALPGGWLHRSHPDDVARTEHLTFVCSRDEADAGPTNRWWNPVEARARLTELFRGSMRGRTMYVVPFVMGPPGSRFRKVGVQVTDSVYVALSMRIMTRMGAVAWDSWPQDGAFTRCLHGLGDLSPERRFICHFPEDDAVWSIGSGYGGNALLGKKCMALRLAGVHARREGWLAEHMLILGVQPPGGPVRYVAAAFPSQCGKTNLAMITPPPAFAARGWRCWTVGDDIAWLRPGADGRLWAVNPEAGFFGVVPGTNHATNPAATDMIARETIFTNVALRPDRTPWWEGHDAPAVEGIVDWRGQPWDGRTPAAHPNSRFTAPARNCPTISPHWEDPQGVPIDAILFGARRPGVIPLVHEARDWRHGVFLGATMSSETTAAATGAVGVLRHDPMAMLPFCGYHLGDYLSHWLDVGGALARPPRIFGVNWFRREATGGFAWPGFGENLRVLDWILGRCDGARAAVDTPLGAVPAPGALDLEGLSLAPGALETLLGWDAAELASEARTRMEFLDGLGPRCPAALRAEGARLGAAASAHGKATIPA
jgi:phosphoenolpyruvate carboxykinase (GTP)